MPTIDWPEALIPQTAQLSLRKAGAQFASPFNGTTQAVDFLAERWTLSASLAQMSARNPRGVDAFCNLLAGGVERVRVWPFHTGGAPRGTLRGAPTLAASVARGATALPVTAARSGSNLLGRSGFELDSNVDGLADGWAIYAINSTGTVTPSPVAGFQSPAAQRLAATALGTSSLDNVGLEYVGGVSVQAGVAYSFSADTRDSGPSVRVHVDWYNASSVLLGSTTQAFASSGSQWVRRSVVGTAPAAAVLARVYVWMQARPVSAGAASIEIDNVQFEQAAVASPYAGPATLRSGDFVGCGGQLFQVSGDVTSLDDWTLSVPLINRVRAPIAAGSAVTWYRPTCEMMLPAMQAGPVRRPGAIESTALDLVEVW
jgi:hypothetical protein